VRRSTCAKYTDTQGSMSNCDDQVQWQRPALIQLFYFQFLTVTHDKSEIWFKYKLLTKVRDNLIPRSSRLGISLVLDGQIQPSIYIHLSNSPWPPTRIHLLVEGYLSMRIFSINPPARRPLAPSPVLQFYTNSQGVKMRRSKKRRRK